MLDKNKSVYLAWQDPETKSWHVVGLLTGHTDAYTFGYTHGALTSKNFIPFSGMEDKNNKYISTELFPLFYNRLLSSNRPEYSNFINWLGLPSNASAISVLGRSGGLRSTDKLEMFNRIEVEADGSFEYVFFAHGLGYLTPTANKRVSRLQQGDELLLCLDCQNSYDEHAVIIRAANPAEIIGYVPRYLSQNITLFLKEDKNCISISVEALSNEAPANYKLMCKLSGKLSKSLADKVMQDDEFQLIKADLEVEVAT